MTVSGGMAQQARHHALELPRIQHNGGEWFVDERLEEIRNVNNPHERIRFSEMTEDAAEQIADLIWRKGV